MLTSAQVPAAWVLCFVPHTVAVVLAGKNYDPAYPRGLQDKCAKDAALDKEVRPSSPTSPLLIHA